MRRHIEAPGYDFYGRTALIAGGAMGIGAAVASCLDARGISRLVIVDLNIEAIRALDFTCHVDTIGGDLSDPGLWESLGDIGQLDHAVINAGVCIPGMLADLEFSDWRRSISMNLDGAFLGLRYALRQMRRAARGSVVMTASAGGCKPVRGIGAYGPAKAGLIHMARVAALEMAEFGVRVNAIALGALDTPIWDTQPIFEARAFKLGNGIAAINETARVVNPIGHYASATELASDVGFLLSDMAQFITGTTLIGDGVSTL